jgi:Protein of unknown function (DUF3107)
MTSIGFGGGEVIEVSLTLDEVRKLLQSALANGALLELEADNGETVIINPQQVKVLQNSGAARTHVADARDGRDNVDEDG